MNKSLRGSLLLLLGAMIWGFAFAAQRMGMEYMQPISFNGLRNLMGGIVLLPLGIISWRKEPAEKKTPERKRDQVIGGVLCGIFLLAASTLQQAGLVETSAGKAGFITALYVVLVPVAAWIIFRKRPGRGIWVSVLLALVGLYFLCIPESEVFSVSRGDVLVLLCAVCFTGQILTVDRYVHRINSVLLSCSQFLVAGLAGTIISLFTETITWTGIRQAMPAMLYAGIISAAAGYTLQILGQKDTDPTLASLIMCLESVFAVLGGALLLGETMSAREGIGCVVMFSAVVLSQLTIRERNRRRKNR